MNRSLKNIWYTFLMLPLIVFVSCVDEDAIRIPEFEEATNLRIVRDVSSFDSTDPAAAVNFTVYSEAGNKINVVNMYVSHFSLIENAESDQFEIAAINGSQITNDGNTKLSFTLIELTEAMGKTPEDLAGGDAVNIYSIVTLTDGRIYPDTIQIGSGSEVLNVTPNIINSSTSTSFSPKLVFPILCDMASSFGTGTYILEAIDGNNMQFGVESFETGLVEITSTSNTGRSFVVPYLTAFVPGFTTTINFDFACNVTLVPVTGSGLGCGTGLAWELNAADPGLFDIADDSEFTVSIMHNILLDCGIGVVPIKFKLTKQ